MHLPLNALLARRPARHREADPVILEEDLSYQLDHAKRLITAQKGGEAFALLQTAAQEYGPELGPFSPATRYRFYRLRGLAYVHTGEPARACPDLEQALGLAHYLEDRQEGERARNALGAIALEPPTDTRQQRGLLSHVDPPLPCGTRF